MNNYLEHFKKICSIPHPSHHTSAIADYIVEVANSKGLDYYRDKYNNVIVYKGALNIKSMRRSSVILQSHIDMVPVFPEGVDASKTPVKLIVDNSMLRTNGTSLGADNGIGVAYMLSILEDDKMDLPPIEALFTADEEVGMIGAENLDASRLSSKYLINLDGDRENEIVVSCAGGEEVKIVAEFDSYVFAKSEGVKVSLEIFGLKGGHSGIDIDKGRANAIKSAIRILKHVSHAFDIMFISISSGALSNVIPSSCVISFLIKEEDLEGVRNLLKVRLKEMRKHFLDAEPQFNARINYVKNAKCKALQISSQYLLDQLDKMPCGPLEVDKDENVILSSNIGAVKANSNGLVFTVLVRSNDDDKRKNLIRKIDDDFNFEIKDSFEKTVVKLYSKSISSYPAWRRRETSFLRSLVMESYKSLNRKDMIIKSTHGGLECGVLGSKFNSSVDMVSIGPDIFAAHSADEHINIKSADNTYALLETVLKNWNLR